MENTIKQSHDWIYRAVTILSFNGGLVSMVTFMSFLHNSVGYVTGNISFAAESLVNGNWASFHGYLLALISFLVGSIISGIIIPSDNVNRNNNYNLALTLEMICIIIGGFGLKFGVSSAKYFLAISMGMQNALTTYYGNSIIRTTHMTGTMTDLGITLGHFIRGDKVALWRIIVYSFLLLGFFAGCVCGVIGYMYFDYNTLFISVLLCLIMLKFSARNHNLTKQN